MRQRGRRHQRGAGAVGRLGCRDHRVGQPQRQIKVTGEGGRPRPAGAHLGHPATRLHGRGEQLPGQRRLLGQRLGRRRLERGGDPGPGEAGPHQGPGQGQHRFAARAAQLGQPPADIHPAFGRGERADRPRGHRQQSPTLVDQAGRPGRRGHLGQALRVAVQQGAEQIQLQPHTRVHGEQQLLHRGVQPLPVGLELRHGQWRQPRRRAVHSGLTTLGESGGEPADQPRHAAGLHPYRLHQLGGRRKTERRGQVPGHLWRAQRREPDRRPGPAEYAGQRGQPDRARHRPVRHDQRQPPRVGQFAQPAQLGVGEQMRVVNQQRGRGLHRIMHRLGHADHRYASPAVHLVQRLDQRRLAVPARSDDGGGHRRERIGRDRVEERTGLLVQEMARSDHGGQGHGLQGQRNPSGRLGVIRAPSRPRSAVRQP